MLQYYTGMQYTVIQKIHTYIHKNESKHSRFALLAFSTFCQWVNLTQCCPQRQLLLKGLPFYSEHNPQGNLWCWLSLSQQCPSTEWNSKRWLQPVRITTGLIFDCSTIWPQREWTSLPLHWLSSASSYTPSPTAYHMNGTHNECQYAKDWQLHKPLFKQNKIKCVILFLLPCNSFDVCSSILFGLQIVGY